MERFELVLRLKPAVNHRRREFPEAIHVLEARFSEPAELLFKVAVAVRPC